MKTKDNQTANCGNGDRMRNKKIWRIVEPTDEHIKKWKELDEAWITALEDGNFEQAKKCIEEMKGHRNPDPHEAFKSKYHLDIAKLVEKMRDPRLKDPDFNEILGPIHLQQLSKKQIEKLEELWRLQICLLRRLRVHKLDSKGEDRMVAHYCRVEILSKILKEGMRLFSLSGANDPTEGKRFAHFVRHSIDQRCEQNGSNGKDFIQYADNNAENMLALQSSFSNRVDNLNQFRLYGRDAKEGGEGTGICLVFKMLYFNNEDGQEIPTSNSMKRKDENRAMEGSEDGDPRLPAYWVLYYDSENKRFYYTPCQHERSFCAADGVAEGYDMSLFRKTRENQKVIQRLLIKISEVFGNLAELDAAKAGWDLCIYLRHLIKDAAFRDEQEIRVLKLCSVGDAEVQPIKEKGECSCLYHRIIHPEYNCPLVKIIAGPKVNGFMVLRDSIRHMLVKQDNVEIEQSDVPLA